jgi:lysozyme
MKECVKYADCTPFPLPACPSGRGEGSGMGLSGSTQSFNRYGYCLNNPLRYTDPSGDNPVLIGIGIYAAWTYLQGAYNNRNNETGKWAWNPVSWFGKDKTGLIAGINTNTDFTSVNYYAGLYSPDFSPVLSYNPNYGIGVGDVTNTGSSTFYYPSYNPPSAEKVTNQFVSDANKIKQIHDVSQAGLNFIADFEGFSATAYKDVAGLSTIGYGHLIRSGENFGTLSGNAAFQLLRQDASFAVNAVNKYVKVPLNQNQFDALTSFTFNIGAGGFSNSSVLRNINSGNTLSIDKSFLMWNKARIDGVLTPVKGLTNRRQAEANLFINGNY